MPAVLVVDDTEGFAAIQHLLESRDFALLHAQGFANACRLCEEGSFDLALIDLDLGMRDGACTGIDLLRRVSPSPPFPMIFLGRSANATELRESIRVGAREYVFKPVTQGLLPMICSVLAETAAVQPLRGLVGSSLVMQRLRDQVRAVAIRDVRVLVVGPSGCGKELVARAIHDLSKRLGAPFIAINCAALPRDLAESELFGHERGAFTGATCRRRGAFELAHHGTLFLDEIEELAPEVQAKLLRVLEDARFRRVGGEEEVSVDVRIIAASNQNLADRVVAGRFREDLFHRINVVCLTVPALTARLGDLDDLAQHFLRTFGASRLRLSADAYARLRTHTWPGNVRELRNVIERALVFSSDREITGTDLGIPTAPNTLPPPEPSIRAALLHLKAAFQNSAREGNTPMGLFPTIERTLAECALSLARGNKTTAARLLHIDRKGLSRRLRRGVHLIADDV
jgi:DNA-binding NtrC family response regulator